MSMAHYTTKSCLTKLRTVWPPSQPAASSITTNQSCWITPGTLKWTIRWSVCKTHKETRWLDVSEGMFRSGQTKLKVIVLFCLQVANLSFSAALSDTTFIFLFLFFSLNDAFIWKWVRGICSAWRSQHTFSHLPCAYESQPVPKQLMSLWLPNAPNNIMLLNNKNLSISIFILPTDFSIASLLQVLMLWLKPDYQHYPVQILAFPRSEEVLFSSCGANRRIRWKKAS